MADKGRKFLLTINNPLEKGFTHNEIMQRLDTLKLDYYCLCDEIGGKENTYHTHIFIFKDSTIRFKALKKSFPPAHIDFCIGTCNENRNYLLKGGKYEESAKAETSIPNTFEEMGVCPSEKQGRRSDIENMVEMVKQNMTTYEIISEYPKLATKIEDIERCRQLFIERNFGEKYRDLQVIYRYGETGTGKSSSIVESFGFRNVYRVTDYKHPFDGYAGEDVIVFEEFYSSNIRINDMLNILDRYPLKLPCRYSNRWACFTKVFINSNIRLEKQYEDIQKKYENTWKAFLRRITKVEYFSKDGIVRYDTVDDYFNSDSEKWLSLDNVQSTLWDL